MQWYAVINSSTGEAISFGTEVAASLPEGYEAIEVDAQPGSGEVWDADTLSVVALPDPPSMTTFFGGVIQLFGHKRATTLDTEYGAVWRGLEAGTTEGYALALGAIDEMLTNEDITEAEHTQVLAVWDAANFPRSQD